MLIKYIGHACFKIRDNETGYSIVFDPYEPGSVPGLGKIVDTASEVLCSHDHFDHNHVSSIKLEPKEESPFEVTYIDAFHDDKGGSLRGTNRIHIIRDKKTGEKLIHYGDTGMKPEQLFTEENLELLKDADIALIPVGGYYTIDGDTALEYIRITSPKVAVPMHFRTDDGLLGFDNIDSIENFIKKAQAGGFSTYVGKMWFYDTDSNDVENGILAIRPQNV